MAQAFVISKKWAKHYWGAKNISEKISVAQFRLNKTGQKKTKLCIINVYGPTSMRQKNISRGNKAVLHSTKKHLQIIREKKFNSNYGRRFQRETRSETEENNLWVRMEREQGTKVERS